MADTDPPLPPIPTPSKNKFSKKKTTKIKTAPPMASLTPPSYSTGSLSAALTLTASLEDPSTTIIVQPVSTHPAPTQVALSKSKHPSSKQKPSSKVAATPASNEIAPARLASSAAASEVPASTTTAAGVSETSATTGDLEVSHFTLHPFCTLSSPMFTCQTTLIKVYMVYRTPLLFLIALSSYSCETGSLPSAFGLQDFLSTKFFLSSIPAQYCHSPSTIIAKPHHQTV